MLSRVASRIYWMSLYIERVENTARLVNTFNLLLLDLPRGTRVSWEILPDIMGSYPTFTEHYQRLEERNTVKYLLADDFNPGSLSNSIASARENCRTSREVLPGQAWEQINELHLFVKKNLDAAIPRRGRFAFLTEVIRRCQQLAGLLAGTMSHDHAYDFIRIGRNIERADMTTRVVDIGATSIAEADLPDGVDDHVWTSTLRALNAYQMYRKDVQAGVHSTDVTAFLLQNGYYPRSVAYCLDQVEESLGNLPRHREALKPLREARRHVDRVKPDKLDPKALRSTVDQLQIDISAIHEKICRTWFD